MWDKLPSEVNRALCLASQKDSSTPWLGAFTGFVAPLLGRPTDLIDEMQGRGGEEV